MTADMVILRPIRLAVLAVLCLAVLPASSALAAKHAAARPQITSVGPATVAVGDTLTIRGRNFLAGAKRNTVTFKRAGRAPVSVKAGAATPTQIKVVIPDALAPYLSATQPTRFGIRVRARRTGKEFTAPKRSVLVAPLTELDGSPADCAAPDVVDAVTDPLGDALGDTLDTILPDDQCGDPAGDDPGAADSVDVATDSGDVATDDTSASDLLDAVAALDPSE
jgi:hypothetical protein